MGTANRFKTLGNRVGQFAGFDTFEAPRDVGVVTMESDEVTAVCPVTGQPDWYTVRIHYTPDGLCIESKSLKLYLHAFRNEGIMCETLASRIVDDVAYAIRPLFVSVEVVQKPRGGITIKAEASRHSS